MPKNRISKPNVTRRAFLAAASLSPLMFSGCKLTDLFKGTGKVEQLTNVLPADASLDQITDHLNNQRQSTLGWRSTDVRITPTGKMLSPKLTGKLTVQGPRNLRLVAESIVGPEVDFGSNKDQFWFWVKRSDPKYVLTGSHAGLANHSSLPLPFPPEWLMEALGVVPLDTTDVQLLREPKEGKIKLFSRRMIQGRSVQRVMIVDLNQGQVVEHTLLDDAGNLIARATMSDFRRPSDALKSDANGKEIRLPHQVVLSWPQAQMDLTMQLANIDLNPDVSDELWQMDTYPGYQVVNLDDPRLRR